MWKLIGAAMAAVVGVCFMAGYAGAQDRGAWFKSLKNPTNGASCCDVADCLQTEARWQGGWFATHPSGRVVAVPPDVVLKKPMSIDGEAYACWLGSSTTMRCFVPPSPGS
jgi:hypothetical protein